ncbi:MAG TPA: hemolysin III family protein [Rhodocyclaceae bacterium]|nr:hemolysin III family protein [Rhodocyclaceae bacterium]
MTTLERFNCLSHLLGTVAAVAGTVWLLTAAPPGDPWRLISLSIYGTSLILLYAISSLSHAHDGSRRGTLTRLDHCSIYLLIAGTYTPFTLVTLRGPWGWSLFGAVWGLALLGILIDLRWKPDKRILPVVIYLIMGWLVVFAIKPLRILMDPVGFGLLVTGGLVYTIGVPFFALGRYWPKLHGIWHVLVLAGSLLHYLAILWYVAPG